jgi:hypothetical protein
MVTCKSFIEVKSDAPSRPGVCTWVKNSSLAEPCCAFHCRTRRSNVRRAVAGHWPGCSRCSHSHSVLACRRGSRCSCSATAGQTFASGSGRVRQVCGRRASSGDWPRSRYLRAVLRSMLARIAARRSDPPWFNCLRSSCTCAVVTLRGIPISNSFRLESCCYRRTHAAGVCVHPSIGER